MKFYRYDIDPVRVIDNLYTGSLILTELVLVKETPKGYWICIEGFTHLTKKWVPKKSKKRYAYPTKKEALISVRARTKARMRHLKRDTMVCKSGLIQIENSIKDLESGKIQN